MYQWKRLQDKDDDLIINYYICNYQDDNLIIICNICNYQDDNLIMKSYTWNYQNDNLIINWFKIDRKMVVKNETIQY